MTKFYYSFLSVLFLCTLTTNAQDTELWGMTYNGGVYNVGTIFKTDGNGNNQSVEESFFSHDANEPYYTNLIQASNGQLYGMSRYGGLNNRGVIFSFNPITGSYTKHFDFDGLVNGANPYGSLIEANDGKLYGMTNMGGTNDMGVLFSYDPINNIYEKHIDFEGVVNGANPFGSLVEAADGKLYGMTRRGGVNSSRGVLFSFDPLTYTYTKHLDFNGAINGEFPNGNLIEASDGKLYGMTQQGGTGSRGVLFSYDPINNIFLKHLDFNGTVNGSNPYGSLVEAADGKLYGMTRSGGSNGGNGVLFSYDPVTTTYVKYRDFGGIAGSQPYGNLVESSDGKLYGMTSAGGANNYGTLFSFSPITSTFTLQLQFNGSGNGGTPYGSLIEAADGGLYGLTSRGGVSSGGVLFSFFPNNSVYTKHLELNYSINGKSPSGKLIEARDGKLYGMSVLGGVNNGVLFSYDRTTNVYTKLLDFNGLEKGLNPQGSLVEASDGKLYGMTRLGGMNGRGVLFSYDPINNIYLKHLDFNGIGGNGAYPFGSLIEASDGKLYGMTREGGTSGNGVLFSYDPITSTFTKLLDFDGTNNGRYPYGDLVEAADGKLYGMTSFGGTTGYGVLFSYDRLNTLFTKHLDFDVTANGSSPQGSLIQASDGKLYGVTNSGGTNFSGVLFSFDPTTSIFIKYLDFDSNLNGSSPYGSLLNGSNGNLYGMTANGGVNGRGVLFEFNPASNIFTKKLDFNGSNGANPYYGALIEVKKAVIWTTANEWSNVVGPTIDDVTIIEGDLAVGTDFGDFSAKSLTIRAGGSLVIESGHVVTVNAQITNLATEADFVVESGANLVQLKDFQNEGTATVKRESAPIVRLDYTAWGAPVEGQNLLDFSPETLLERFYTYDYSGTTTATAWIPVADPSTTNFEPSHGYLLRAPNTWSPSVYTPYQGEFIGKPNNGSFQNTVGVGYNLLGNPYPSPLSADAFLTTNASLGASSLYYWTHAVPQNGAYVAQTNYASYNFSGGTAAIAGGVQPDEFIQVGQGFLVNIATAGQAQFTNAQRSDNSNNQFFRTTTTNVDRFWLGLRNDNASYNQMLVAYINGATNGIDLGYDAKLLSNGNSHLSSLINNENYVIQGRNSVFEVDDEVSLSFTAEQSGMFTISLDAVEGIFNSQDILLWDKQLNIYHNLQTNDYSFTTGEGTFNSRFSIVYDSTLSNPTFDSAIIFVYKRNNGIVIKSTESAIEEVQLYDITGRLLFSKEAIGTNEYIISQDLDKQLIIVKTKLENNKTITTKILR